MDATIRVNNTKEAPLEFDVNIQGVSVDDPNNAAQVRFVITNVLGGALTFSCDKSAEDATKWTVKLPALPMLKPDADAHTFRIEVIVDGYYFEPACGNLILLKDPEVKLNKVDKPKVSATVAIVEPEKKEEPKKEEPKAEEGEEKKEPTAEGMGQRAGSQEDMTAPDTKLLRPEFAPEDSEPQLYGGSKSNTPAVDAVYGDDKEEDEVEVEEEPTEDAQSIADKIVKETLGASLKKPTKSGFLFKRAGGRAVVEGLEPDAATKEIIAAKQRKVKEILAGKY